MTVGQLLVQIQNKPEVRILGLMSGTSLDGLDVSLVRFFKQEEQLCFEVEQFSTLEYPSSIRSSILEVFQKDCSQVLEKICSLNTSLAYYWSDLINSLLLSEWSLSSQDIDAIASHGQTFYHLPQIQLHSQQSVTATLQLGDADIIATQTGILTLSDFRMKDTAVGGEGAPLVPYADAVLFQHKEKARILHNLGGISNLTYLPPKISSEPIFAFDTGPANVLINLAINYLDPSLSFDPEGSFSSKYSTSSELLEVMMSHPYFKNPPPKSTGRELFGDQYWSDLLKTAKAKNISKGDLLATVTSFTAHSIQKNYELFVPRTPKPEVFFSGGGVHNKTLMTEIQNLLPWISIRSVEELGVQADEREAVSFAVFAYHWLKGQPVSIPGITGSQKACFLGKLSVPF